MWSRVPTGAVGTRGDKKLRDGGVTTQPEFGGWDPLGKTWVIEGHGIDPDVTLGILATSRLPRRYRRDRFEACPSREPQERCRPGVEVLNASCRPSKGQLGCGPY